MKKLLNVVLCLVLGFAVAGCETQPVEEVPTVDVEVSGEAVEVIIPDEAIEVVTEATEAEEMGEEEMMNEEATEEVTE